MAGDLYWNNVSLLTHCDNGGGNTVFVDAKGKVISTFGNAVQTTSSPKFGTTCMFLDGAGDYLTVGNHADFHFGSGDFTVEYWIKPANVTATHFHFYYGPNQSWWIYHYSNLVSFSVSLDGGSTNYTALTGAYLTTNGQWYHIACVRTGSLLKIFINGVERASTAVTGSLFVPPTNGLLIGQFNSNFYLNGFMDEIRITKGVARYTTGFSPPTAPFDAFLSTTTYALSGVTRDASGALASRLVRAYKQDNGAFVGQAVSAAGTGVFSIDSLPDNTPHYVTLHDTTSPTMVGTETGNAAILDNIIPIVVP